MLVVCEILGMGYLTKVRTPGGLIRTWREEAGLSGKELAERVTQLLPPTHTLSDSTLNRYENNRGPAKGLSPMLVKAIAAACLVDDEDIPPEFRMEGWDPQPLQDWIKIGNRWFVGHPGRGPNGGMQWPENDPNGCDVAAASRLRFGCDVPGAVDGNASEHHIIGGSADLVEAA